MVVVLVVKLSRERQETVDQVNMVNNMKKVRGGSREIFLPDHVIAIDADENRN